MKIRESLILLLSSVVLGIGIVLLIKCSYLWYLSGFQENLEIYFTFWFSPNAATSIIIAVIFYAVMFVLNYKTALIWLLFYDASFELTGITWNFNIIAYFLMIISIALIIFSRIKFKYRWWYLFGIWIPLTIISHFYQPLALFETMWAIAIIVVVGNANRKILPNPQTRNNLVNCIKYHYWNNCWSNIWLKILNPI